MCVCILVCLSLSAVISFFLSSFFLFFLLLLSFFLFSKQDNLLELKINVCLYGIYLLYVGVGDMTKIIFHNMSNLFHSNNIYHNIVIFAL